MEIRTCEQYVLAEIEDKKAEIERLKERIIDLEEIELEQSLTIGRLVTEEGRLNEILDLLLRNLKVEEHHISAYVWSGDPDYDIINDLKKEREPNSEENDSQNNVLIV